jgi:hypothetical protein
MSVSIRTCPSPDATPTCWRACASSALRQQWREVCRPSTDRRTKEATVASAGALPPLAAWLPSASLLLRGPSCCSPDGVCPEQRPAGLERSGVVAVVDPASSKPRRRSPLSSSSVHPSGVGVRDPAVQQSGVRSPGVVVQRVRRVGRLVSTRFGVQPSAVHPCGVRPSGVCPVCPDASVSSHAQAVALGTQVEEAETRATLPTSGWSGGGRWRTRAAGLGWGHGGRACPLSDQAGQAGAPSAPRGRLRGGHGSRWQREVAAPATWLPSSGWGRDHGGWSSPRLTAGVGGPEGPLEVPAGMDVRPQRGPSRRRALLARCWKRCDLRRWVVGLPGLEPGTSSLSAKSWFHNGWSRRAQISAHARCRNAVRMSARRS